MQDDRRKKERKRERERKRQAAWNRRAITLMDMKRPHTQTMAGSLPQFKGSIPPGSP